MPCDLAFCINKQNSFLLYFCYVTCSFCRMSSSDAGGTAIPHCLAIRLDPVVQEVKVHGSNCKVDDLRKLLKELKRSKHCTKHFLLANYCWQNYCSRRKQSRVEVYTGSHQKKHPGWPHTASPRMGIVLNTYCDPRTRSNYSSVILKHSDHSA